MELAVWAWQVRIEGATIPVETHRRWPPPPPRADSGSSSGSSSGSGSSSDSGSDSSSNSSSSGSSHKKGASRFLMGSSDSESEDERRVVRSAKDKAHDELRATCNDIKVTGGGRMDLVRA